MIKKKWFFLFLCIYLSVFYLLSGSILKNLPNGETDMAAVNRIMKEAEDGLDTGEFHIPEPQTYDFAVLDENGLVLFLSSPGIPDAPEDTARANCLILDVKCQSGRQGKLLVDTGFAASVRLLKKQVLILFFLMAALLLIPAILYYSFLNRKILVPFRNLERFAHHIAAGNLDVPLPMDQGHVFGAFTESFDLMREQLKDARQKEALADKSKKELVASLSHDIKTPVASIKITSELLMVTEKDPGVLQKIGTIYNKSEQIDRLITNMLQSSLEDLGELKVNSTEESSTVLAEMIRQADYGQKVDLAPIPDCILMMDCFRMEQVIGNILNNSYKYAGTAITVTSALTEEGLRLEFMDYGKGVPEEELPFIFQKFYRGQNHPAADGSGLGLSISRNLMEKMGGMIDCFNREDGFSAALFIPLARFGYNG